MDPYSIKEGACVAVSQVIQIELWGWLLVKVSQGPEFMVKCWFVEQFIINKGNSNSNRKNRLVFMY